MATRNRGRLQHYRRGKLASTDPPQRLGSRLLLKPHAQLGTLSPQALHDTDRDVPAERAITQPQNVSSN